MPLDMPAAAAEPVLLLDGLSRSYRQGDAPPLEVLKGVSLEVRAGELVALVGPSGAGKSTLLHAAGLLERPDSGRIRIGGEEASDLNDSARTALRRRTVGFVYQFHHLLPEFSALENVVIPQLLAGTSRRAAEARATDLLTRVGLASRLTHRPAKLSGGEQQRVAIARALANKPRLLIADEPTGNLDIKTSDAVFALLEELLKQEGLGALIATHNLDLARRMDRMLEMKDGTIAQI